MGRPLFVGLVLAAVLSLSVLAPAAQPVAVNVWMLVPAVESEVSPVGELINVSVSIHAPGSGRIEVSAGGEVAPTTRFSMETAVKVGSLLAGVDWRTIDVEIRIGSSRDVSGPSGSLAVAMAVYGGLTGALAGGVAGYTITGAVSPDGLAARVGGIMAKCAAARGEGLAIMLPLSNAAEAALVDCGEWVAVAGILHGLASLRGAPEYSLSVSYELPGEFHLSMRAAASDLREEARRIMSGVPDRVLSAYLDEIESRLSLSSEVEDENPYAAASLAFTALTRALTAKYEARILAEGVGSVLDEAVALIQGELGYLAGSLDSLEPTGSVYYVEFLATAYTRLADARAFLLQADEVGRAGGNASDVAALLGIAEARVDSIRHWMSIAVQLKGEGPVVGEEELRSMVEVFSDYVETSAAYAQSLVRYIIENVNPENRQALEAYLDAVRSLLEEARRYREEGNLVASLGFYREALSRSLQVVFSSQGLTGEAIEGYRVELDNVRSLLVSAALSRGYASGLSEAYASYAAMLSNVSPQDSIAILEEAVASSILWATLTLQGSQAKPSGVAAERPERPELTPTLALVVASIALTSLLVGYLASLSLVSRASRSWARAAGH